METTVTEVTVRKAGEGGGGGGGGGAGGEEGSERDGSHSSSGSGNGGKNGGVVEENEKETETTKEKQKEREKENEKVKEKGIMEYFGWVYHLGTNSIGHQYCHLRFLFVRGKYVEMYKRDPHQNPGIKPIRRGVAVPTLVVEELGRQKVNHGDVYVVRFYNRLDETKKGEIACATAGEARKWMEAFDHAKQQAEYELSRGGSARNKLNMETEINLEGHRPRVRRYAHGLKKLIRIGQGPEMLLRHSSNLRNNVSSDMVYEGETGDAFEAHDWKCVRTINDMFYEGETGDAFEAHDWTCVRTINGIRVFEDVSDSKSGKGVLVKAVGVIDASADAVFEVILNVDRHQRYEWDTLTGDLELLDSYDGHYDIVYGTSDPKYLTRWQSKKDFIFSRQWFSGRDGEYTILQFPATHKKRPPRSGYKRTKINRLKEYIGANPALKSKYATAVVQSKDSDDSSGSEYEDAEVKDEFYDAISGDSSSSEESDDEDQPANEEMKVKLKNVSWAITSLAMKRTSVLDADKVLDPNASSINIDLSHFQGSLPRAKDEMDSNCWSSPSGMGFMIRGKTYLKDNSKVMGGEPLLKLVGVDWFKVDSPIDRISLHPKCLVQTEAGKKLPFILVINLQIPAKPNYSLILYYVAERPVNNSSLLGRFIDGTDVFRDSRFKLIPSIIEGYWMVKRAVGTKACLLGKAVTCNYLRQDNFLEIDVDIGSSSVARSVIGLVLGYVTSLVVDLAILIEAKEEAELPEYILGTVRLSRIRPDSAVPLEF